MLVETALYLNEPMKIFRKLERWYNIDIDNGRTVYESILRTIQTSYEQLSGSLSILPVNVELI